MEHLREWWGVAVGLVGLIAWALRVEFAAKANASEIRRLWYQRDEDLRAHKDARDATNAMLREVRDDIKKLIERAGR